MPFLRAISKGRREAVPSLGEITPFNSCTEREGWSLMRVKNNHIMWVRSRAKKDGAPRKALGDPKICFKSHGKKSGRRSGRPFAS